MNSTVQVGQGRFTNSLAVRARPVAAAPAVLQMLAQSIAALNDKIDALALRTSQPPARVVVESREVEPLPLATRPRRLPSAQPVQERSVDVDPLPPLDEPMVDRRRLRTFFE